MAASVSLLADNVLLRLMQRTMHANFVNLSEMHTEFHDFYKREWPVVFRQVMEKLSEYDQPFYPLANIVEKAGGFDNVISKIEEQRTMSGYMSHTFRTFGGLFSAKEEAVLA